MLEGDHRCRLHRLYTWDMSSQPQIRQTDTQAHECMHLPTQWLWGMLWQQKHEDSMTWDADVTEPGCSWTSWFYWYKDKACLMVVRGLRLAGGASSLQSLVTVKTETSLMLRHQVKDFMSASRVVSQTVLRADLLECLARDSICKTGDRKMRCGICWDAWDLRRIYRQKDSLPWSPSWRKMWGSFYFIHSVCTVSCRTEKPSVGS